MSQTAKTVRVRMYNVGFGDCFLLFIPDADRDLKVLIDCGMHPQGQGEHPIAEVVGQVIEDVREADGVPRIDVVVATHRHQDHVSGFIDSAWGEVEVREVWMPWTEDRQNPEASRLREAQSRGSRSLLQHATQRLNATHRHRSTILALAENSQPNAKALTTLHDGFAGRPAKRFLPSRDRTARSFEVPCLPGVRVHALGPSHDLEVIRDMEPPPEASYLQAAEGGVERGGPPLFHSRWVRTKEEIQADSTACQLLDEVSEIDFTKIRALNVREEEDLLGVAVQLERAINGTSLVLVFQIGRACLLFPGDAQWGTWQDALSDPEWREMLSRTTFYKVGHHGSHNATPTELVEEVFSQGALAAMVSTRAMGRWPQIPRQTLMEALSKKCDNRIVRSDAQPTVLPPGFRSRGDLYTELEMPL